MVVLDLFHLRRLWFNLILIFLQLRDISYVKYVAKGIKLASYLQ